MNHCYHTLWNRTLGAWVAVPETARSVVKSRRSGARVVAGGAGRHFLTAVAAAITLQPGLRAAFAQNPINVGSGQEIKVGLDIPSGGYAGGAIDGRFSIESGTSISNSGVLTVNPLGSQTPHEPKLDNYGVFVNEASGELSIHGKFFVDGAASFENQGLLNIDSSGGMVGYGALKNSGAAQWNNSGNIYIFNGSLENIDSAVIRNLGGVFSFGGGLFTNGSEIENASGADFYTYGPLNNNGVVRNHGNFKILGANGRLHNLSSGLILNSGNLFVEYDSKLINDGNIKNINGAVINGYGSIENKSVGVIENSGKVELFGGFRATNDGTWINAQNTSSLYIAKDAVFTNNLSLVNSSGATIGIGGELVNTASGGLVNSGVMYLEGMASVKNDGDWKNSQGGTIWSNGAVTIGSTGVLTNEGQLSYYSSTLVNNGLLDTSQGNLFIGANASLKIGSGGVTGRLLGNVTNDGKVIFDRSDNSSYSGSIGGSGNLIKQGGGALRLDGASTYSGKTSITGGTLQMGVANALGSQTRVELSNVAGALWDLNHLNQSVGSLQGGGAWGGDVGLGSATLTVGRDNTDSVFGGLISGSGRMVKQGSGALTMTGANTYSGGTSIEGGTLVAASSQALGLGAVGVSSGAVLSVPAHVRLGITGNLGFAAGATYQVAASADGAVSSRIDVSGTAALAGSLLRVGPQASYVVGQTYTILQARSVSGQFTAEASQYAYLDLLVNYSPTDVQFKLQRKSHLNFAGASETPNQSSVAKAVESLPATHPLYQLIEKLPQGTPAAAFNSLSGDAHAQVAKSVQNLNTLAPQISLNHAYSNLTAGMRPGAPIAQSGGALPASAWPSSKAQPVWTEVVGRWQRYNEDGNAAGLTQRIAGLFVGADHEVGSSGWRAGGSVGTTHANGNVAARGASFEVNSYSATLYGSKRFARGEADIHVLGGMAYTWHDIRAERTVAAVGQKLRADYRANTAQLFAEVGYALRAQGQFGVEPFVGLNLGTQRTQSFQETGGFAAVRGERSRDALTSTTLGVRAHADFQWAGKSGRVRATAALRRTFGDLQQSKTMAFDGGQSFVVAGTPLARHTARVGLEAELELSRRAALVVGYQGEYGNGFRDHAASVKMRWAF